MAVTEYCQPTEYPTVLGRGILRIKKTTDLAWQDLGNVEDLKLNTSTEEKEHETSRYAQKYVDKSCIVKTKTTGSFVCDTPVIDNMLLFLYGANVTTSTQTSGIWTAQDFEVVTPNCGQELGKRFLTITSVQKEGATVPTTGTAGTNTGNGTCTGVIKGVAIQNGTYTLTCTATGVDGGTFSVTAPDSTDLGDATVGTLFTSTHISFTINDGSTDFALADSFTIVVSGTTALVENTDYVIDTVPGIFVPLSTSTLIPVAGATFQINGSYTLHTIKTVKAGESISRKFEMLFVGDPATGVRQIVYIYAVLVSDGDLVFIGDEFQKFSFKFTTQSHPVYGRTGVKYEDWGAVADA